MSVATDWLEQVRSCASKLDGMHRELSALMQARDECLPWQTKGSTLYASMGGSHSDPTAADAQSRIDGLDEQISAMRAKVDHAETVVGECLRVLDAMRAQLGGLHADVLELYYIDLADTWSEVADEMGLSARHVRRVRDAALGWIGERIVDMLEK